MIPLKLQIKNFLSYGSELQTIDFEPYHLICLSGKNGHGKSALLDAITWALWGQARKISGTAKADDGLLKIGQSHMMVIFDFACNGQMYRVKREYGKTTGKPYAALDFGMYNTDNTLISLTEKKIRATQRKIEQTIHLTLDSFVNSAFLRQGQANEFSKKSPKDRKDIFAQILGLQEYDHVKKLAMEKAKQAVAQKEGVLQYQEKITTELEKKKEIISKIDTLKKSLTEITDKEKNISEKQKDIDLNKKEIVEEQKNLQILTFKLEQLEKKEKENHEKLREIRDIWKKVHEQQIAMADQSILEKEKNKLIETISKHQKTFEKKLSLKEQYLKSKEALHNIEKTFYDSYQKSIQTKKITVEKLQLELAAADKIFKELLQNQFDKNKEKKQTSDEIAKLTDTIALNTINKKELESQEKQFEKRKEHYQQYITQGNWIKQELDSLKQKQCLSQDEGKPSCPLCEQNLSATRKKFLKAKFTKQETFFTHRLARLSNVIKNLKQKLIEQHEIITKLKKTDEKNKLIEVQIKELQKKIKSDEDNATKINTQIKETKDKEKQLGKQLEEENKHLNKLIQEEKKELEKTPKYKNLAKQIAQHVKEIKALQYDEAAHKQDTNKLQEIEKQLAEYDQLKKQITLQEERKKNIHTLCVALKEIKKQKIILSDKIAKYASIAIKQKSVTQQEHELVKQLKEINHQKSILLQEKGSFENQLAKLTELEKEYNEQKKLIKTLDTTVQDYKIIAAATGKNGIQALLIENAIPEVEQEANSILSRLTNNQAQIFIESLRDLKKGGTKETLDIKISDAAGIRQYELFSGGEAFRIDFALRIAISKLLARRSGTALQTLIIDEGFGSQDEEGLSKIMDALYKIQEDFSKVIIVSHLSTMKDQFPVHFFVQKGPHGSKINVIQQG